MKHYKRLAIKTKYWKPGEDHVAIIVEALEGKIKEGDFVVVSEKAISTATGNIVDESTVRSCFTAMVLAKYWMRYVWAYVLGPLCHLRKKTISHFRNYPVKEGGAHKQTALQHGGFLQALRHSSEGGIDVSNLPYSYASLPLKNAHHITETIRKGIESGLDKSVSVLIVDTDRTYSWRNFHFSPRPNPMEGIQYAGGIIAYVFGRVLRLKKRATPLAVTGTKISIEEALKIAELANRARGGGAGRTLWKMAAAFNVTLTNVSLKMLENAEHKPITIVRRI